MHTEDSYAGQSLARSEYVGLALASLAFTGILVFAAAGRELPILAGFGAQRVLLLAIGAGAIGFVVVSLTLSLFLLRRARVRAAAAAHDAQVLRQQLLSAQSALTAEPQVLLVWKDGARPQLVAHGLDGVAGLPRDLVDLLRFGTWLEADAAAELKRALDTLFNEGKAFNILMRTLGGAHIEADGRAAGARAVLRLRDVAGQKRELARIVDQHRRLGRDIAVGRALFDALPMPVWLRADDGRLEWVNAAYANAVEAETPEQVVERQIELLESRQRKDVAAALTKRETYKARAHVVTGGERRAFDLIVLPLERASAGVAVDAAALESAQGELSRQSAAHEGTLDRVSTGVAIFGADQRLSFFNDAFHKLWILDPDWLAARPSDGEVLDRLREMRRLPEVANYRDFRAKQLARYGTQAEQEDWWHLPDRRTVHVTVVPRPDGGRAYLYDDVSEKLALQRRYELMIHVQKETLDNLKEAVALFATDGRLKLFNPAFTRIWKLEDRALLQEPHIDEVLRRIAEHHDDKAAWEPIKRAVTEFSDQRQALAGQMQRADQTVIDYALVPMPDGNTLLSFADVTDTKRIERALTERNEALVAADRLKNQFISHVSYELRTPLQSIIGFSELMASPRTGLLTERQRDYVTAILASSETLKVIINGILDLATIDAGALELRPRPVEARGLIEAAAAAMRDRASRAGIRLEVAVGHDVAEIVADEERLKQVLYNLLTNAISFSEAGKTVRLGCERAGGELLITVADEGKGIAKEDQPKVFERFVSRAQGAGQRGTGLGLPLVKSLVELHGGTVALESEPGLGTMVFVRLPLQRGDGPVAKAEAEPAVDMAAPDTPTP
jgi:signal transduction histidine kinase